MRMSSAFLETDSPGSWLSLPGTLTLGNNEVHVWRASLDLPGLQLEALRRVLTAGEITRAGNYYFQKDRDNSIASRGLLRSILGKYLQMGPGELRFRYGAYGKPALDESVAGKKISFNVSHSNGLALFAVSSSMEIGIDLEYISPGLPVETIAGQLFSNRETAALNALPEDLRQEAFYTCWVRKEACMKAKGTGLAQGITQYEVLTEAGDIFLSYDPLDEPLSSGWSLRDLDAGHGFAAALAVEGHDFHIKLWDWKVLFPTAG